MVVCCIIVNDSTFAVLQMNKIPTLALARQDGIQPSLEAENLNQEDFQTTPAYTLYISPFDRYPLLRSQSSTFNLASSSFMHTSSATSDLHPSPTLAASLSSASSSAVPDLKPLRLAVLGKQLDPSKQLCRYECGDGKCRDDKCEDLHLSRLEGMIASGLLELTGAWCVQCNALELTYFGIRFVYLIFIFSFY